MEQQRTVTSPEAKPTPRQVYALAHELAKRAGQEFPRTRGAASDLIDRLRRLNAGETEPPDEEGPPDEEAAM